MNKEIFDNYLLEDGMITSIDINNFRCFNKTTIKGFKRVNLIGGKNNSGKTCLLEALYLNANPMTKTIMELYDNRGYSAGTLTENPRFAWNGLFLSDIEPIIIKGIDSSNKPYILEIIKDEPKSNEFFGNNNISNSGEKSGQAQDLFSHLENEESYLSLYLTSKTLNKFKNSSLLANKSGLQQISLSSLNEKAGSFIPSIMKIKNKELAQEFSKANMVGKSDVFIENMKIIDSTIIDAKTISIGEPAVYLQRKNEPLQYIGLFGDSVYRFAKILLEIINGNKSILLIDEIENGIHYENQYKLWKSLFVLAKKMDNQIFATTHSLEMMKAFNEVSLEEEFKDEGSYIELYRNINSGEIDSNEYDPESLNYHFKKEYSVRGT